MNLFLDTEFTGLDQRNPKLISLGLVSEDGRESFYAELPPETYDSMCSMWVRNNVLPLLEMGDRIMQPEQLRQRLLGWIKPLDAVTIVTDAPEYDFSLLKSILVQWPKNVQPTPIRFDSFSLGLESEKLLDTYRGSYFTAEKPQHHSLHDAWALRQMWLLAKPGKRGMQQGVEAGNHP